MKNKSIINLVILGLLPVLASACTTSKKETVLNDCSAIFETVYVDNNKNTVSKKPVKTSDSNSSEVAEQKEKPMTTCKILEVKIDDKNKCELVGSDRIDNLTKALSSDGRQNKIVIVAPEKKFREMGQAVQKYIAANNIEVQKYLDSDIFKNLKFAYKGLRCKTPATEFSVWSGGKKVIITIGD